MKCVHVAVARNLRNVAEPDSKFAMIQKLVHGALTVVSAILLSLPFHFPQLHALSFVALIPFFCVLRNCHSSARAALWGYVLGFVFFFSIGYWLYLVNVLGLLALVLYLALYFSLFAFLCRRFFEMDAQRPFRVTYLLSAAALWVLIEWLRSVLISGLPWAILAHSQWQNIPFIQIADITGVWGISFFIFMINALIFGILHETLKRKDWQYLMRYIVLLTLVSAVTLGYGKWAYHEALLQMEPSSQKRALNISILQGNIPQDQKWDNRIKSLIFEKYKRMTLMSAIEKADLIVWPETSFPGYLEDEALMSAGLRSTIRQSATDVLVGAPTVSENDNDIAFYNSAILYGPDGEQKGRYNKIHLVPFGEYLPFEPVTTFLRYFVHIGRFSPGKDVVVFQTKPKYHEMKMPVKYSALICYEDIFPYISRKACLRGAELLINMTNDAWFGKTTAAYQHAQGSVFRAIENRVPVVRSTNTGFSCFISTTGDILNYIEDKGESLFVTGRKTYPVVISKRVTFYTRYGDVFLWLLVFLCLYGFQAYRRSDAYMRSSL